MIDIKYAGEVCTPYCRKYVLIFHIFGSKDTNTY